MGRLGRQQVLAPPPPPELRYRHAPPSGAGLVLQEELRLPRSCVEVPLRFVHLRKTQMVSALLRRIEQVSVSDTTGPALN
jgi:hypothetical protein